MTTICEADLGQPLLAFAFAFYILTVLWAEVRKCDPRILAVVHAEGQMIQRYAKKGNTYRLLVMAFTTIVFCYTNYPVIYSTFIPIKALDNTWVNVLGILFLLVSIIWIVIAQVDFDKEMLFYTSADNSIHPQRLTTYSKKIRAGNLLMFIGLSISLANVLSFMLLAVAFFIYKDRIKP
jgi:hypothetical protein